MTRKKILVADCQVFQEPAWHRGMGKYSLALLENLLQSDEFCKEFELKLLFNDTLPMDESMLGTVKEVLGDIEHIRLALPIYRDGASLVRIQEECQHIIDNYFDKNIKTMDVTFLIMSLFMQFACPVYPSMAKKVLLYYDLIMLEYYRMYLGLGASEQHFAHYKTLFESDLILSISKTVANDLTIYLGIPKTKIVNIDGAPIERIHGVLSRPNVEMGERYILMPSGGDPRKNNHRAVQGFEIFNQRNNGKYKILLTSMFGDGTKKELRELSEDVVFTGNVAETELAWLFENCEAVLFAPEYEGLGLPILEAADHDKPVACSDISVFREISSHAFYYFDHMSPASIAEVLQTAVNRADFDKKRKEYPKILSEYSWKKTVNKAIQPLLSLRRLKAQKSEKMAVLTPNIQTNSFAGYYAALQYPSLSNRYEVDYYYDFGVEPYTVRPNHLAFVSEIESIFSIDPEKFKQYSSVSAHLEDGTSSMQVLAKLLAFGCDVELYSSSLSRTYHSMVKHNIISSERLHLEEILNERSKNGEYLTTLVSNAKTISAYNQVTKKALTGIAKTLHLPDNFHISGMSLEELPYEIDKSSTASNTLVYLAEAFHSYVSDLSPDDVDSLGMTDLITGISCNNEVAEQLLVNLNYERYVENPTDFETVSMIQRSRGVLILGSEYDTESIFIQARCRQLGVPSIVHASGKLVDSLSKLYKHIEKEHGNL